jgi:hypothetical protein
MKSLSPRAARRTEPPLVTTEEKARIEQAATAAKRSMSDWLRVVAGDEIERQLARESTGLPVSLLRS